MRKPFLALAILTLLATPSLAQEQRTWVQYDADGNISATVTGTVAPKFTRQIEVKPDADIENKKVDPETKKLIEVPPDIDVTGKKVDVETLQLVDEGE